jgi:Fe-S-cluster-containing dehydrogenase component
MWSCPWNTRNFDNTSSTYRIHKCVSL